MKRFFSVLLLLLLLPCLALPALAAEKNYVADYADLLLPEEEAYLNEIALVLNSDYGVDVVILTVAGLEGGTTPQTFADDYYDSNGYGENGVLFLLSMAERDWYISTCGDMIYALTDYGIQEIASNCISHMSSGNYFDGFCQFLFELPLYIEAYKTDSPVDGYADYSDNYYHAEAHQTVYYQDKSPSFLLSLMIGIFAGGIVVFVLYRMMDDKNMQHGAAAYIRDGSFRLNTRRDLFLYSNVSKTRRQQNNNGHGGPRGGGSSVHHSSGGRRHGGGGGKF